MTHFALCSVVNDRFVAGYITMVHSFRQANPELSPRLYVIAEQGETFLSPHMRDIIQRSCGEITWIDVDPECYTYVHEAARTLFGTPPRLHAAFYIFEAFYRPEERFILCLDSDILVLGSFAEVMSCPGRFAAVRARGSGGARPEAYVNTGVIWLDRTRLGDLVHPNNLMKQVGSLKPLRGTGLADQAVINIVWPNRTMFYLPQCFNFTKRSLMFKMTREDSGEAENYCAQKRVSTPERMLKLAHALDIRALHFVGEKPWDMKYSAHETSFGAIDDLWWESLRATGQEEVVRIALQNQADIRK